MRRRLFLTGFVGLGAAWPLAARALQPARIPRLGVLLYTTPQADPQMGMLQRALNDLGYVYGQNLAVEYRYAEGKPERLPALASEIVALKPDVLFVLGGDVTPFVSKATQTIPIVFVMSADPVKLGLVASLSRPGGNATGVTYLQDELASKRLQILKQAVPQIARVAFLWNPDHPDNELHEAQRAADALGVKLQPIEVRGPGDLDGAFQAAVRGGADALYAVSSRQTVANVRRIADFSISNKMPLAGGWGAWVEAGALLSYGPNTGPMVRTAASYADRILKGARPADLPVQQPTRFELLINLKTAKALGLTIPPSIVARADEVIE